MDGDEYVRVELWMCEECRDVSGASRVASTKPANVDAQKYLSA